ncbi:MAG TPA: substrate-binding domain-containing protein [Gemmatimonadaceae bacterium]|jgi:ribose transport system substrate-binding protein|nr:substrate-binding domain-containing protein [Gemmatimonadaceae bacterium]
MSSTLTLGRVRRRIAAALLVPLVLGCKAKEGGEGGAASAGATKTIGVSLLTREHDFYQQLEAGLEEAAAKHGYKLIITTGDFDLAKQQSAIDNFLVQHVDAILVCPTDTKGIAPAIEKANAANIPVFTADIGAEGAKVVSHIASDNVAGGRLAGEYIAKAIGGKGNVGIVNQPELQSVIDRETGFRAAIARNPGIKIVSTINGAGVRDRSLRAADDMFQAHPDVRAVFAINDETALGVLASATSHSMKNLVIVGYDAAPEALKAIAAGTQLKADVAQQPREIGKRTIEAIAEFFAGQRPPPVIAVPVRIVDADSIRAAGGPPKA